MPQRVQFDEIGFIEFPDEFTSEQIQQTLTANKQDFRSSLIAARQELTRQEALRQPEPEPEGFWQHVDRVWGNLGSVTASTVQGATQTGAGGLATAGRLMALSPGPPNVPGIAMSSTPGAPPKAELPKTFADVEGHPLVKFAAKLQQAVEEGVPHIPTLQDSFLLHMVPSGVGSWLGMLPGLALGPYGPLLVGGGAEASSAFEREMQRQQQTGEPEDVAKAYYKSLGYGTAATAIEARLGIGRIIRLARKAGGPGAERTIANLIANQGVWQGVKSFMWNRAKDAGAGATEEGLQSMAEDFIVTGNINIGKAAMEAAVGAPVQALAGGVVDVALRPKIPTATAPQVSQLEQEINAVPVQEDGTTTGPTVPPPLPAPVSQLPTPMPVQPPPLPVQVNPVRMIAAAYRTPNGQVITGLQGKDFSGVTHMEADMAAEEQGIQVDESMAGFLGEDQKFYTREQAYQVARSQIVPELDTFAPGQLHTGKMVPIKSPTVPPPLPAPVSQLPAPIPVQPPPLPAQPIQEAAEPAVSPTTPSPVQTEKPTQTEQDILDWLSRNTQMTFQQVQLSAKAFAKLPQDANAEVLQKEYLRLALPADMPSSVGLGETADLKGAKRILNALRALQGQVKPPTTKGGDIDALQRQETRQETLTTTPPATTPGAPTTAQPLPASTLNQLSEYTQRLKKDAYRTYAEAYAAFLRGEIAKPARPRLYLPRLNKIEAQLTKIATSAPKPRQARVPTALSKAAKELKETRPPDVIDDIENVLGGYISIESARAIDPDFKPIGRARRLFRSKEGKQPTKSIDQAQHAVGSLGTRYSELSGTDFLNAINAAATSRKGHIAKFWKERKLIEEAERELLEWSKATAEGAVAVHTEELAVGDELVIEGEPFKVIARNPETGEITLKDGQRFGVVKLPSGQVFYADSLIMQEPEGEIEFGEPEPPPLQLEKPESVEEQRQRLEKEAAAKAQKEAEATLAEQAAKPLTGGTGTLGQGGLFEREDLFSPPAPSGAASVGKYNTGEPILLGDLSTIRPAQLPEVAAVTRALTGKWPAMRKLRGGIMQKVLGRAQLKPGGTSLISPELFRIENLAQLEAVNAHELGHLDTYFPELRKSMGNLFAKIAKLRSWFVSTFPLRMESPQNVIQPAERRQLYREAENKAGPRPDRKENPEGYEQWRDTVRQIYSQSIDELIEERGLVKHADIFNELWALSQRWRPLPAKPSEKFLRYRRKSDELYADAISVLFNNPGMLQKSAPKFWTMFWNWLDAHPAFKQQIFELQTLLQHGEGAVVAERVDRTLAGYAKGEQLFMDSWNEKHNPKNSLRDWVQTVMHQSVDRGNKLLRDVRAAMKRGVKIPPWLNPRFAYEQFLLSDNRNMVDLIYINQNVLKQLAEADLTVDQFSLILQNQRVAGQPTAQASLIQLRNELGPEKTKLVENLIDLQETLEAKKASDEEIIAKVTFPLQEAGIDEDTFNLVRQLQYDVGTRTDLANPQLIQPEQAQQNLRILRQQLGETKWKVIEQSAHRFRSLVWKRVQEAHAAGLFSDRFMKVAQANWKTYATFRTLDHIKHWISPQAFKAYGTTSDIESPFITTILKLTAINKRAEKERALKVVRDFYAENEPESFEPLTRKDMYWDGAHLKPRQPKEGRELMALKENGKTKWYAVDQQIYEAFDFHPPNPWPVLLLHKSFRGIVYPVIVRYNPAFQFWFNPKRDFKRSARNLYALAGVSRSEFKAAYNRAWDHAVAFSEGRMTPLLEEMLENAAIGLPWDTFGVLHDQSSEPIKVLFERYKVGTAEERRKIKRQLMKLPNAIERFGVIREAQSKIAGYELLTKGKKLEAIDAAEKVRKYVGTPFYQVKGTWGSAQNAFVPFLNIYVQGLRADIDLMRTPGTRGGWWFDFAWRDGWKPVFVAMATAGLLGDWLKELYERIPEHDRANFWCIPIGIVSGGPFGWKTSYIRVPYFDSNRFLVGSIYKLTRAMLGKKGPNDFPTEIFGVYGNVLPSINPLLEVKTAWQQWILNGYNPVDPGTGVPIIKNRNFIAKNWGAYGDMMSWTVGNLGGSAIWAYSPSKDVTLERLLSATPVLNRVIKISDYGLVQDQYREAGDEQKYKQRLRLGYGPEIISLLSEYDKLRRLKENLTKPQVRRLATLTQWHAQVYSPLDEQAWKAYSTDAKDALERATYRLTNHPQTRLAIATRIK